MLVATAGGRLDVERGPDWLWIRISDLDPASPPRLADELWDLAQKYFIYRLVLELDQVQLLNSHLIGQLIQLYKRIQEHDGVLRLCGLSPYNRRVLQGCALNDRFPQYQSREDAILGGSDPRLPR